MKNFITAIIAILLTSVVCEARSTTIDGPIPGLSIEVDTCYANGDMVTLELLFTNTTDRDIILTLKSQKGDSNYANIGSRQWNVNLIMMGNHELAGISSFTFPPHTALKGTKQMLNPGRYYDKTVNDVHLTFQNSADHNYYIYRLKNIPINRDSKLSPFIKCTDGSYDIRLNSAKRIKGDLIIDLSITNTASDRIDKFSCQSIFDNDGETYTPTVEVGGKPAGNSVIDYNCNTPKNVPVHFTLTVPNFSRTAESVSMAEIKTMYATITIKNLPIK